MNRRNLIALLWIGSAILGLTARTWADTRSDKIQEYTAQGFQHIYNLEYDQADQAFKKLAEFAPEDPAGYCYQATNLWLRELFKGRELAMEHFTSAAYFSKAPSRKIDPAFDQQFRTLVDQAIEKANAQIRQNPKDTRALYFMGTAYGALGSYEMTIHRKKIAALKNANKAVEYHRQVLKIDPQYYDSYLTVGLYEYVTGMLPWSIRWIARIVGYRGNKQKGLEQIKLAAEKGHNNRNDACVILSVLYVWEMQFDKSLQLLEPMHRQFPKNYLLQLDIGALYRLLKKDEPAAQVYQDMLSKIYSKTPHYELLGPEHVHYRLGVLHLDNKNHPLAIDQLTKALQLAKSDEEIATMAHLKLGKAYDLANHRAKAQEQYKIVLKRDDVKNSQDEARRYLRRPYIGTND